MITCLKDWLEEGLSNSQIELCRWGPENGNDELEKGPLSLTDL